MKNDGTLMVNLPDSSQVMGNLRGDDFSQDQHRDSMGMDDEESIPLISSH